MTGTFCDSGAEFSKSSSENRSRCPKCRRGMADKGPCPQPKSSRQTCCPRNWEHGKPLCPLQWENRAPNRSPPKLTRYGLWAVYKRPVSFLLWVKLEFSRSQWFFTFRWGLEECSVSGIVLKSPVNTFFISFINPSKVVME